MPFSVTLQTVDGTRTEVLSSTVGDRRIIAGTVASPTVHANATISVILHNGSSDEDVVTNYDLDSQNIKLPIQRMAIPAGYSLFVESASIASPEPTLALTIYE